jgi:hypothetical protein
MLWPSQGCIWLQLSYSHSQGHSGRNLCLSPGIQVGNQGDSTGRRNDLPTCPHELSIHNNHSWRLE